jgi:hypothetical protein
MTRFSQLLLSFLILATAPTVYANETSNRCSTSFSKTEPKLFGREDNESPEGLRKKRLEKVELINNSLYQPLKADEMKAELLESFETIRIFPSTGRIPKDAKVRLVALHGNGATYSQSDAMSKLLRLFGESGKNYKSGSTSKKLRNYQNFTQAAVEAIDIIGHGVGPLASKYNNLEKSADYLIAYLRMLKQETPELPLVVFTRSGSGILLAEAIRKAPDLVDASIIMSSPVPRKQWVEYDFEKVYELERQGKLQVNKEGLAWAKQIMLEANWDPSLVFGKTPTLILTGAKDFEVENYERHYYELLSQMRPNIEYRDLSHAGHDILRQDKTLGMTNSMYLENLKYLADFLHNLSLEK